MTSAHARVQHEVVVALDYGQFYLHTADSDPDLAVELLERALEPVGIAQQDGLVIVVSPHQNNFAMRFRVEVWDSEPLADLDQWQEAFEVHLEVGEYGITYESPTMDFEDLGVPAGSYHALITGRGFVTHGWPGSTEPGDSWRLRLWPSAGPTAPRRLAEFVSADPDDDGGDDDEQLRRDAADAASARIRDDVDQLSTARALSGRFGVARIDVVLPRDPATLWALLANLGVTPVSGPNDAVVGNEFSMSTYDPDRDGFVGTEGEVVCRWLRLEPPTHVAMTWTWMTVLQPGARRVPRLPYEATLAFTLTDASTTADPRTRLELFHAGLPREWVDDMETIWLSKVDQWLYQSRPREQQR